LGEAIGGGDLEEGRVESGIGGAGVEPTAGEAGAITGARETERDVHRRVILSLYWRCIGAG